jgi:hypothetical protein
MRWEAEELEQMEQFGRIRCNADSSHELGDPAHEAVGTERTRHAAIVAVCCWHDAVFCVPKLAVQTDAARLIAGEMHMH